MRYRCLCLSHANLTPHSHFPRDTPFSSTPLTPRQPPSASVAHVEASLTPLPAGNTTTTTTSQVRRYKCSACHTVGHNSKICSLCLASSHLTRLATESNPVCPKHPGNASRENLPAAGTDQLCPGPAAASPSREIVSGDHTSVSPKSPAHMPMNALYANSPEGPTITPFGSTSTDPLQSLFATPTYRRNAQVKTLDMIIVERSRASRTLVHDAGNSMTQSTDAGSGATNGE